MSTAPLITRPAPYQSFSMMGVQITPKVLGAETGGQFSMVEATVQPEAGVTPLTGRNEAKIFYIVSGEFEFLLGNLTRRGRAGDTVFVPAGTIHCFKNTGTELGKLFVTFTPAGHEEFLRELSDLFQGEDVRPEDIATISGRYGVEMIG